MAKLRNCYPSSPLFFVCLFGVVVEVEKLLCGCGCGIDVRMLVGVDGEDEMEGGRWGGVIWGKFEWVFYLTLVALKVG
ncbi:hypothetical protein BDD12DRAFT_820776 [Trichophaea hybrida]|nr:hypothetical protein BDD12DRAFT_820776 [Trichophaea hybrida]